MLVFINASLSLYFYYCTSESNLRGQLCEKKCMFHFCAIKCTHYFIIHCGKQQTVGNVTSTTQEMWTEERARKAEREAEVAKNRAAEQEARAIKAEERAYKAEREAELAKNRVAEQEARAIKAEESASAAECEAQMFKERAAAAEEKAVTVGPSWIVQREEIDLTDKALGTGGWGVVRAAKFRGLDVAAKHLHHTILSSYNLQLFKREMSIAAMARHPNLVLFIGATVGKECIILTELMPYSLREILEIVNLSNEQVLSVAMDVCRALNYLHSMRPVPIVHRDVSSANVLLESLSAGKWRAKLSDYGSANFVRQISTVVPGSIAYAAPESLQPSQQSPKMDTFSYGVLLLEMTTKQFPDMQRRVALLQSLSPSAWVTLITVCISNDPGTRPDMTSILARLKAVVQW